jgi:hypothetical protein
MTNAIYLISEFSASEIASELEKYLGTSGRYIITEYTSNSQGRLTEESWFLLMNKYHKPNG